VSAASHHRDLIVRSIHASLVGDSSIVEGLFSPEVQAWLPAHAPSAVAVAVEIEDRCGAFVDVSVGTLQSGTIGPCTWVEWFASATHVGEIVIEDTVFSPTGRRTVLHGVTFAEFDGDQIVAYRQSWESAELGLP